MTTAKETCFSAKSIALILPIMAEKVVGNTFIPLKIRGITDGIPFLVLLSVYIWR
jgi:hypothetical protein